MKTTKDLVTMEVAVKIKNVIAADAYDYYGVRIADEGEPATVGQVTSYQSAVWIDGEETEEKVNCVCCIKAGYVISARSLPVYIGDKVIVYGANFQEFGEDEGELILRSPVVLAIF